MTREEERAAVIAAKSGDRDGQEKIIKENIGLVKSIAARFSVRGYEREDIIQLGMIGLFKAVEKFDISLGVRLSTYAVPMISGEIKRYLRDDGIIKVSRSVKELNRKITAFNAEYGKKEGKSPSLSYTAKALGVSEEEVVYAMNAHTSALSLDEPSGDGDGISAFERIEDKNTFSEEEITDRLLVNDILKSLKPRERKIIIMRYFMGMTQSRVAEKISVSQVQVSREEKRILSALKEKCITGEK